MPQLSSALLLYSVDRKRVVSAAADVRASSCHRDHEAETHPDLAEQDRSGEGDAGQGTVRGDTEICTR